MLQNPTANKLPKDDHNNLLLDPIHQITYHLQAIYEVSGLY